MNVRTVRNKVVVKAFPPKEKTISGIIIPDTIQLRPNKATVVATGMGTIGKAMEYKEGDIIYHVKDAGEPIEVEGMLLYVLEDMDILCKISKD